jgi:hypothetical protein
VHGVIEINNDRSSKQEGLPGTGCQEEMKTAAPVPLECAALKEQTAPSDAAIEAAEETISLANRSEEEVAEARNEFGVTRV